MRKKIDVSTKITEVIGVSTIRAKSSLARASPSKAKSDMAAEGWGARRQAAAAGKVGFPAHGFGFTI